MVPYASEIRQDLFVRRPGALLEQSKNRLRSGLGDGRNDDRVRRGAFAGEASVNLSDGARQALRGSERALELARDFNAARLGRPARRRFGEFFQGFSRDLGASERDIERVARHIGRLTDDFDRRFGDAAERIFGRLGNDLGGSFRSTEFSLSQISFSLQVDTTILSVVEEDKVSTLRLDQVQFSLQAVQIDGRVSTSEGFAVEPEIPLFSLPDGETASDVTKRLAGIVGASAVSTELEARQIELDLSTTIFTQAAAGLVDGADEAADGAAGADGGVSLVA